MQTHPAKVSTKISSISPQLLVDDLKVAIDYYCNCLGFETDFVYESFYASVSRDGYSIHLKCAPKSVSEREQRRENEHLDAYIGVQGIEELFDELNSSGAVITRPLEERPWGCKDFYVEDHDGNLVCFSEVLS